MDFRWFKTGGFNLIFYNFWWQILILLLLFSTTGCMKKKKKVEELIPVERDTGLITEEDLEGLPER